MIFKLLMSCINVVSWLNITFPDRVSQRKITRNKKAFVFNFLFNVCLSQKNVISSDLKNKKEA